MRFCIQVSKEDLEKLQELEDVTGIRKSAIVSILIDEVYSGYKCAKISRDFDYMPIALATKRFKNKIRH